MLSLLKKVSPHAKQTMKSIGHRFGFDIRINGINSRDDLRFFHFLKMHKIDMVLDVGANKGQFAELLFKTGYQGQIVSFEPLPSAHAELTKTAAKFEDQWIVVPPVAIGNKTGVAKFYVTEANTSSSLLKPLDSFIKATPTVKVEEHIEVPTERLDVITKDMALSKKRVFLKIDVQGSENQVFAGAMQTLKQLQGVLVEMSFAQLYAEQASAIDIQKLMDHKGFQLWDIWRGYHHPVTYRLNQVDALFFRDSESNIDISGRYR